MRLDVHIGQRDVLLRACFVRDDAGSGNLGAEFLQAVHRDTDGVAGKASGFGTACAADFGLLDIATAGGGTAVYRFGEGVKSLRLKAERDGLDELAGVRECGIAVRAVEFEALRRACFGLHGILGVGCHLFTFPVEVVLRDCCAAAAQEYHGSQQKTRKGQYSAFHCLNPSLKFCFRFLDGKKCLWFPNDVYFQKKCSFLGVSQPQDSESSLFCAKTLARQEEMVYTYSVCDNNLLWEDIE